MYSKVFGVGEFKYANKNFRGAKGVAIATKFTQKGQNSFVLSEFFREQKELLRQPNRQKQAKIAQISLLYKIMRNF